MSSNILAAILSVQPFTEDKWLRLLEHRYELIKPYLKTMSLEGLGDVECLSRNTTMPISLRFGGQKPCIECFGDIDVHFDTPGLYGFCRGGIKYTDLVEHPVMKNLRNGIVRFWGLTRNAEWLLITVHFVVKLGDSSSSLDYTQVAERIEIHRTDVATIISRTGFSAKDLRRRLGDEIFSWESNREQLYKQAKNIANRIRNEDLAIEVISGEK